MRLVIAFNFSQTLACKKTDENAIPRGRNDYESCLTECQQNEKGVEPLLIPALNSKKDPVKTFQYPLAVGVMRNLVFALNDNPQIVGRSVFIMVITKGRYTPDSIRRFFIEAYNASLPVAASIRVVTSIAHCDRGLRYNAIINNVLEGFCQFLNSSDNRQESYNAVADLWSFIRPEMVYFFDDNPENREAASSAGFTAVNSREPEFFNHLIMLANIIRSESFFKGIPDISYDDAEALEADGWAVVSGPLPL